MLVVEAIVAVWCCLLIAGLYQVRKDRLANRHYPRGRCVVCGSTAVEASAGRLVCSACGYVGRTDGGGGLTDEDVDSMVLDSGYNDWWV